ncbi:MAG: hypothetical protein IJF84_08435 [Thermoguttaceae bacterium]|nr:hypothetical protein [Thermoguttaceae bacterium]
MKRITIQLLAVFALSVLIAAPVMAQRRDRIVTENVSTAEELVQHIFNSGIVGIDAKGATLYEADFSKMEPTDSSVIDEVGYQKVQFLNPRRISFGSKFFVDLWRPAPEPKADKPAHWENAREELEGQNGVRLFRSSYANLLNDDKYVQPRSWRQRVSAARPDRGRNYTMSVSMFNPRYYAAPNANVKFFGEDELETEIPWDAPELNQPDISPVPLLLNWSTKDSNLNPFLEIPKMSVKDAEEK